MKRKRIFATMLGMLISLSCFNILVNAVENDIYIKDNTSAIKEVQSEEVFLMSVAVPETDRNFGDNVLFIDTTGDDANDGLSPENAIKTLKKAQTVLAGNNSIDTIVVVNTYKKSDEASAAVNDLGKNLGRKIYITGYSDASVFDMRYYNASNNLTGSHLRIYGDIEFNNINLIGSSVDGGIMSMGYELTLGENITVTPYQNLGVLHANAQYKDGAVINVLSGIYNKVDLAVQTNQTYKGTSTINIGGTAETKITNGHGWPAAQNIFGINNVNIDGGKVTSISLSTTSARGVTNYSGLRYFTINGGNVGDISTTGSSVSEIYNNNESLSTTVRAGVTVFEINGGKVGTIAMGINKQTKEDDPEESTRVVIFNNGMTTTVEDEDAIVVKTTNGTVKAVTNAYDENGKPNYDDYTKLDAEWGKAINFLGLSYDTTHNSVVINGNKAIPLVEFKNGYIYSDLLEKGKINTIEFITVPKYSITFDVAGGVLTDKAKENLKEHDMTNSNGIIQGDFFEGSEIQLKTSEYNNLVYREGYVLNGFKDSKGNEYTGDAVVTIIEDEVYTLIWKEYIPTYPVSGKVILVREYGDSFYADNETGYYNAARIQILNSKGNIIYTLTEAPEIVSNQNDKSIILISVDLEQGTYTLNVTKNGYLSYSDKFDVNEVTVIPEIKLVAGDIKNNYEAECGDGAVDIDDFIRVLRGFTDNSGMRLRQAVDINEDGVVNVLDLACVKSNFNAHN